MPFKKYAKLPLASLYSGTYESDGLKFTKSANKIASVYQASASRINVQSVLNQVAKEYDISTDPHDYIYEVARAVTAEIPNENADAFGRSELLRFDHILSKPVYQTFILKPHQVNHRADNPKTARGVVLDASYNDLTPAVVECPSCGTDTTILENRDKSGINCVKCGSTVKDEFVELLLAIDTKKDPVFAEGVRSGSLDSLSMGCFIPGTKVKMSNGATKNIEDIKVGDDVVTHTGDIAKVKELSVRDYDGDVCAIKIAGHKERLVATLEHPFYTNGSWTHAQCLQNGTALLSPAMKTDFSMVEDTRIARLAGYFVADGNYVKDYDHPERGIVGIEFTLNLSEQTFAAEINSAIESFGFKSHIYPKPEHSQLVVKSYRCKELADRIYALVGQYSGQKVLSNSIFMWDKEAQLNFLGAYINGDGTFSHHGKKDPGGRTAITSSNKTLIDQLSTLLTNNNIPHAINTRPGRSGFGGDPGWDVVITGNVQQIFNKYSTKIIRPECREFNFSSQTVAVNGGISRPIKDVERYHYTGKVHNFEVDHEDHSYIAGDVAVHNCEAGYTDCSICDNRARSVSQFCTHIKSGNKKKMFKTASGMRMSFEKCGEVVFQEISRVDQPADPTAKQRELLNVPMSTESELLVMATRIAKLESFVRLAQADPSIPQPNQQPTPQPNQQPTEDTQQPAPTKSDAIEAVRKVIEELSQSGVGEETSRELEVWQHVLDTLQNEFDSGVPVDETQLHSAQVDEASPQVPFKTVAESIKWAESSIYKLKAENHRLASEKEAKFKDAATAGRPVLAWENAAFTAQTKANDQYIGRLEKYIGKARELEASGAPWSKDITRSMSRFFANKQAQVVQNIMDELDEVQDSQPELVDMIKKVVDPNSEISTGAPLSNYLKERAESEEKSITTEEMGIEDEEFGVKLPGAVASVEQSITSDLNKIMEFKENQVGTSNKFAGIYGDIQVSVTKVGNVRVSTPKGNMFVIRPIDKPKDVAASKKVAREVLSHIAEHGLTDTMITYNAIVGPKMAQVLEYHIEDFVKGREEGDKDPMPANGEDDLAEKREKPEDTLITEEITDRAEEGHEQRDQGNSDVLEKHMPDHKLGLPPGVRPITDGANDRDGMPDSMLSDVQLDISIKKPKRAEWEKPWEKKEESEDVEEAKSMKEVESTKKDKKAQAAPPPPAPGGGTMAPPEQTAPPPTTGNPAAGPGPGPQVAAEVCSSGQEDMCSDPGCPVHGEKEQDMRPIGAPPIVPAQGMPMMGSITDPLVKEAAAKHVTRLERLYQGRMAKAADETAKKMATLEKTAVDKAIAKLSRAIKLASRRQALNLEFSPLKAAMHDVLVSELELDSEYVYPGMDNMTASRLVEAASATAFSEFTESLMSRAAEFLKMSDEALTSIEVDVKNLRPVSIQVQASVQGGSQQNQIAREAALDGNLIIAPAASDSKPITSAGRAGNIRLALNTTKVNRASKALKK
jgi:hypothetical protein